MDPERMPEAQDELPRGIGVVEITLTVVILLLLAGTGVYYFLHRSGAVGQAISTPESIEGDVESFFHKFGLTKFIGDGAKLCLMVPLQRGEQSIAVRKTNGVVTVRRAGVSQCDGEAGEDFIIKYTSAAQFSKNLKDPKCANVMIGNGKFGYFYLPSKLWPQGDRPTCNAEFRERYCAAISYCIEPSIVPGGVFSCCAEALPNTAKAMNEAKGLGEQSGNRLRDMPTA